MLDAPLRRLLSGPLDTVADALDRPGVTPDRLTLAGLAAGVGSAGCAAAGWWATALVLWLLNRTLDGLDGPLARRRARRGVAGAVRSGAAGGFLDITADFTVYGATTVGVAVGVAGLEPGPDGWSTWLPFLLVLLAYYVNGAAFLAFSSIAERTGRRVDDGRSLSFLGGLAEGTETIVVHAAWLLAPSLAPEIAWVWAVVVGAGAAQRVVVGRQLLEEPPGKPSGT